MSSFFLHSRQSASKYQTDSSRWKHKQADTNTLQRLSKQQQQQQQQQQEKHRAGDNWVSDTQADSPSVSSRVLSSSVLSPSQSRFYSNSEFTFSHRHPHQHNKQHQSLVQSRNMHNHQSSFAQQSVNLPLLNTDITDHTQKLRARFVAPNTSMSHNMPQPSPALTAAAMNVNSSPLLSPASSIPQLHQSSLQTNPHIHQQFQQLLDEELNRVNSFVLNRLLELRASFTAIDTQSARISHDLDSGGDPLHDNPDDTTLDPIKAAYVELYKHLMFLQSFALSNANAFLTIIRQYALFSHTEKDRYQQLIEGMEMKNNRDIMTLTKQLELVYAELCIVQRKGAGGGEMEPLLNHRPTNHHTPEALTPLPDDLTVHNPLLSTLDSNSNSTTPSNSHNVSINSNSSSRVLTSPSSAASTQHIALLRSQARALLFTHQLQPTSWSTFDRGMRFGITLLLFFWVVWDCVVDARLRPQYPVEWVQSVLPVYRGIGVLLLLEWGWGCNLYIWDRYRINYMTLLELDPRNTMTYAEVFDEATTASMMFLANFLLYFKILRGDFPAWIPAGYFPIFLFLYMLYKLAPWAGQGRSVIWNGLIQVFTSPFGQVTFLTVYLGDILTSLVKPIIDWSYTLCFLFTLEWIDDTVNDEICLQSRLFNYVIIPLLSALPLWFRFMQCLKRYWQTRQRWPHVVNAGKYALSHCVVLFGVFHHTLTDTKHIDAYRIYWIISLVISSLYSYTWDIFMDWGLGNARKGLLRESLMYSNKWVYYVSMVADLFLRFAWSLTLVPRGENAPFPPQVIIYLQPLLAIAEVIRRSMWGALRLEWEHIQTIGYKKLEKVNSTSAATNGATGGTGQTSGSTSGTMDETSGFTIILEVAVITAVVLGIGGLSAYTAN